MARVLLNTDIFSESEVIERKDTFVVARATDYLATEKSFKVSVPSVMEIVYGFNRLGWEERRAVPELGLPREPVPAW